MATAKVIGDPVLVGGLYSVITGTLADWPTETPPTGWLARNGASLLMTDYPELYAVLGKLYGSADATHFNLPNDMGRFTRLWDHAKGTDPDRATRTKPTATGATILDGDHVGTEQPDAYDSHGHTQDSHLHKVNPGSTDTGTVSADHSHTITKSDPTHSHYYYWATGGTATYSAWTLNARWVESDPNVSGTTASAGGSSANHTHTVDIAEVDSGSTTGTNQASTGSETRPVNRAYLPIIKY